MFFFFDIVSQKNVYTKEVSNAKKEHLYRHLLT